MSAAPTPTQQLLVEFAGRTYCIDFPIDHPVLTTAWLTSALVRRCRSGKNPQLLLDDAASPSFLFVANGAPVGDAWDALTRSAAARGVPTLVRAHVRGALLGGKGGFGANLRASGKSGPAGQTRNFDACRDLYGRRLKAVNDEIRLRKWQSDKETQRRKEMGDDYREPSGPAGMPGWYLGVPSWAEGFKTSASGDLVAQGAKAERTFKPRKKTSICNFWLEARTGGRGAPPGAPRSWGCPRGRHCDFAHGEEELRSTAKVEAAALRRETAQRDADAALEAYTKGLYVYPRGDGDGADADFGGDSSTSSPAGSRSMLSSVLKGMRAIEKGASSSASSSATSSRKRGREEPVKEQSLAADVDPSLLNFSDSAWLVCLGGTPVDVEVEYLHHSTSAVFGPTHSSVAAAAASSLSPAAASVAEVQCTVPEAVAHPHADTSAAAAAAASSHEPSSSGAPSLPATVTAAAAAAGVVAAQDCVGSVAEVEGLADFASVAVCGAGLWQAGDGAPSRPHGVYYEVELLSGGVAQIGWATSAFAEAMRTASLSHSSFLSTSTSMVAAALAEGDGVGDHEASWAFDGSRRLKWNGESLPYGRQWEAGDVVGCYARIDSSGSASSSSSSTVRIAYSLNGEPLGVAFEIPLSELCSFCVSNSGGSGGGESAKSSRLAEGADDSPRILLYPCISLEAGELVRINLGKAGFAYPPSDSSIVSSAWTARRVSGGGILEPQWQAGGGGLTPYVLAGAPSSSSSGSGISSVSELSSSADAAADAALEGAALTDAASSSSSLSSSSVPPIDRSRSPAADDARRSSEAQSGEPPSSAATAAVGATEATQAVDGVAEMAAATHAVDGLAEIAAAAEPVVVVPDGPLDLDSVSSAADIAARGYQLADLKRELEERGLKCGCVVY